MSNSLFDDLNLGSSLDTFKKNTSNAMNTVKSSILTPVSTITEKVNDGIALVKATDSKLQSVVSSYKSAAIEQLDGIIGALSGGMLNTSDLTKMVRVGPDGVTFSPDDLVRDVGNKIGLDLSGGGNGFMNQIASGINSQFNSITSGYFGDLVTTDGKSFKISKNWRGQAGSAMLDMLRRYGGIDDLIDVSVTNSFYNTLLYNSAQFGMSDSYASIIAKYQIKKDAQAAMLEAIQYMLANGDVDSLQKMLELMDKEGVMSVNARYPEFVENLLSKFTFAANTYPEEYPAIREKLLNVLTSFAGPNWHLRSTQFGSAYNLALTSQISADVTTLLMEDPTYSPLLFTSGMFQDTNAIEVLKNQFPGAPILSESV
ncbi:hypothetical protein NFI00_000155 [Salmonella enterica]|nr:hypothetical protein [Salmonella enterica]